MSRTRVDDRGRAGDGGCAALGVTHRTPGVAVSVGDSDSHGRVDEATSHLCEALGDQFKSQGNVVPMGVVRQAVVRLLTLRSQATQIADAYGIEPGTTYADDVEQRRRSVASAPEDVREDYVMLTSSTALANDVAERVGASSWRSRGSRSPRASRSARQVSRSSTPGPTPTVSMSTLATGSRTSTDSSRPSTPTSPWR